MKSALDCVDPRTSPLLDNEGPRDAPLSLDQELHLGACAACRTSARRLLRLTQTWRTLEPSVAELARAVNRLRTRPGRAPRPRRPTWILVAAGLLFTAVASAAIRIAVMHPRTAPAVARTVQPTTVGSTEPVTTTNGEARADPVIAPHEGPTLSNAAASTARPPPAGRVAPKSRQLVDALPSTSAKDDEKAPSKAWADAAAAMRVGDYARAERAFDTLATASDPATRDSARLARAQVWLAQGRRTAAREELEELAGTAASSVVREQAAADLARIR